MRRSPGEDRTEDIVWFYTVDFFRGLNKMSPSVPPTGNQEELKQVFFSHDKVAYRTKAYLSDS